MKKQYIERHMKTNLGHGNVGPSIADKLVSHTTFSSMDSQNHKKYNSSKLLSWLCATRDLQDALMLLWLKAQSKIPSHTWCQPSGQTAAITQQKTKTMSHHGFYNHNSEPSLMKTQKRTNKRPYQAVCSQQSLSRQSPTIKKGLPN